MPFNPKFTITPKINKALVEKKLGFIPSASLRTGITYDIKYRMGKELDTED